MMLRNTPIILSCFILFILLFNSCSLFFSAPYNINYHKESEVDDIEKGAYLSDLIKADEYWNSRYNVDVYFYIVISEYNIEIYVLNIDMELLDAVKGEYTIEYNGYNSFQGDIAYKLKYDFSNEEFIDIEESTTTFIKSNSVFNFTVYGEHYEMDAYITINNFLGMSLYDNFSLTNYEIDSMFNLEDKHGIIYTADADSDGFNEVYKINETGSSKTLILDSKDIAYNISTPKLSTDEKILAFRYFDGSNVKLGMYYLETSYFVHLYYDSGDNITGVCWDNESENIYFTTPNIGADDGSSEIKKINKITRIITNVTNDDRRDQYVHYSNGKITFIHHQNINNSYSRDVYVMNEDGSAAVDLMNESANGELTSDDNPKLNSDASIVAFQSFRSGNYPLNDIYTVPSTGGIITRITTESANRFIGGWSSDSEGIFLSKKKVNGDYAIYKLGLDGIEEMIYEEVVGVDAIISQTF